VQTKGGKNIMQVGPCPFHSERKRLGFPFFFSFPLEKYYQMFLLRALSQSICVPVIVQ